MDLRDEVGHHFDFEVRHDELWHIELHLECFLQRFFHIVVGKAALKSFPESIDVIKKVKRGYFVNRLIDFLPFFLLVKLVNNDVIFL